MNSLPSMSKKQFILKIFKKINKCTFRLMLNYYRFIKEFSTRAKLLEDNDRFICHWKDIYVCFDDNTASTSYDHHYVYHVAWSIRKILRKYNDSNTPFTHVDFSSSINFITTLSASMPVEFYDYRPADISLDNLICKKGDLTNISLEDNSVHSLSCMHVVEHIGLTRYGDALDPKGDLLAMHELQRILAPNGTLYFVIPIGSTALIQYNAHRIYTYKNIIDAFSSLTLNSFAFVDERGIFHENTDEAITKLSKFGCGCFEFEKPSED